MRKLICVLSIGAAAASFLVHRHIQAQGVVGIPEYEITTVDTMGVMDSAAPQNLPVTIRTSFKRKDGTFGSRTVETRNGRSAATVGLFDLSKSAKVVVQENSRLKTTYPLHPEQVKLWRDAQPMADCSTVWGGATYVSEETISGLQAQKLHMVNATEDSTIFVVPVLNCLEIRSFRQWKDSSGHVVSWTSREPAEVRLGPPRPDYFLIDNMREAAPSEAQTKIHEQLFPGQAEKECWLQKSRRQDADYLRLWDQASKGWPNSPSPTTAPAR